MAVPPSWQPEAVVHLKDTTETVDVTAPRQNWCVPSGSALSSLVEQQVREMAVPAAIVLLRTPEETWTEAFGTRRVGVDDPVTTADHFRIGSNTKTMTGTALLQLVDAGSIALDDPVSRYRPEVPDSITVAQLLDMRSGLKSYTTLRSFNQAMDDEPERAWDPEELVAIGLAEPVSFTPGAGWEYSNTNTVLAGLIVEQITGRPLADVLHERIFEPLGMDHTLLPAVEDATIPDPHPHGYLFGTNVSTLDPEDTILPTDQQAAARAGTLLPGDYTNLNPSWAWAAGAGISTVQDLATYVEALVGGGLLSDELQRQRLDSIPPADPSNPKSAGYGLAIARFGPMLGHDGSQPGYQSFMGHDPATGITLIIVATLQFGPAGEEPANRLAMAIIDSSTGRHPSFRHLPIGDCAAAFRRVVASSGRRSPCSTSAEVASFTCDT
jgi:D-alanyl-D-alanine carboxypeptidase